MGLILLLLEGALLIVVVATAALVRRMLHPSRRGFASALAAGLPADPADLQFSAQEVRFHLDQQVSTPGWLIAGDCPAGPVVVLTHGWSTSRYSALRKAVLFRRFASMMVAYDLRGHGSSTAGSCTLGLLEPGDLIDIVEQLPASEAPLIFFGSSMGAGISLAAAVQAPEAIRKRIIGVILEGPYRHPMEPVAGHLRLTRWPTQPFTWLAGLYLALRLRWLTRRRDHRRPLGFAGFRGFRGLQGYDRAQMAARLHCPLLVLHGSDDAICPLPSAKQIAAAARQGTFVEFAGGQHGGLAYLDEDRYREALEQFVAPLTGNAIESEQDLTSTPE